MMLNSYFISLDIIVKANDGLSLTLLIIDMVLELLWLSGLKFDPFHSTYS